MKRYDVYGMGHALVDMEYRVDDPFLHHHGLTKGTMTLMDEARQQALLDALAAQPVHRSCGGSASNTMIGLAQFGGCGFHACKVANDESGRFFADDMKENGVANRLTETDHPGTTGKCLVLITPDAERTLCTNLGISASFGTQELSEADLTQAHYLYIEGYLISSPSGCQAAIEAAQLARKKGVKVALTFSDLFIIQQFRESLDKIIDQGVDLLFCNENEAMAYTNTHHPEQTTQKLRQISRCFGLTLGAKGATIGQGNEMISIPGFPAQAVDSNGAGDLFAGAFLYGLTNGLPLADAGRLACRASSVLVAQYGARLQANQAKEIMESSLPPSANQRD